MNSLSVHRAIERVIVVGVLLSSSSRCGALFGSSGELRAIIEAWDHRQNEIKTLQFSWSGVQFQKGVAALPPGLKRGSVPPDTSFETRTTFVMDASGRVRLDYEGKAWSDERSAYISAETNDVFDGELRHTFFPKGGDFPNAHITAKQASVTAKDVRLFPIRLVYRAFDPVIGVVEDQARLTLTETKSVVDGHSCLVLRHPGDWFDHTIWVDRDRSFVPLRYVRSRKGVVRTQVEISYSQDKEYGWVPTSWNIATLHEKTHSIQSSWSATVTQYTFNQPIPDATFQLTYPPGTWVHNYVTDEEYIVREGGDVRPILPGEFDGSNYEQLLHSDPPSPGRRRLLLMFVINALILLVASAWFFYFRKRRTT